MSAAAYLEITMHIAPENRPAAAEVYGNFKEAFLTGIDGAVSKDLLVREEDVQVLHGFASTAHAEAYLETELFQADVFTAFEPLWRTSPDVRIYMVASAAQRQVCNLTEKL